MSMPNPNDGKKHPAIVWITGGDCNSIDAGCWRDGGAVTAISDGDPALPALVRSPTGGPVECILDWFHFPCACTMSSR